MSHWRRGNGLSNKPVFRAPMPSPTANTAKTLKLMEWRSMPAPVRLVIVSETSVIYD